MIVNPSEFGIKTKLKACPFCGAKGVVEQLENYQFYPRCMGFVPGFCLLRRTPDLENDGFLNIANAIEVWNRRPKRRHE